jgi:hypothetical protein
MENSVSLLSDDPASKIRALRERVLANDPAAYQELDAMAYLTTLHTLVDDTEHVGSLQEFVFTSDLPVIGPLLCAVRSAVNNIASKWVTRALLQQQNKFNALLIHTLREMIALNQRLLARVNELENRVRDMERETSSD